MIATCPNCGSEVAVTGADWVCPACNLTSASGYRAYVEVTPNTIAIENIPDDWNPLESPVWHVVSSATLRELLHRVADTGDSEGAYLEFYANSHPPDEDDDEAPTFDEMADQIDAFLRHYPADVFDGSSSDPGPRFVAALRSALTELRGAS